MYIVQYVQMLEESVRWENTKIYVWRNEEKLSGIAYQAFITVLNPNYLPN